MLTWMRATAIGVGLLSTAGCIGTVVSEDESDLNVISREARRSRNGLPTITGFGSQHGLIASLGLTSANGLSADGSTVHGLATRAGVATDLGRDVDCSAHTDADDCTGEPDGLLSARTGLMASDDGELTASYVVRCALDYQDSVRVKSYTGELVTLSGELGLTPQWKTGSCDAACQEKISACLMAYTNGKGEHVDLEMSAAFTLGTGHSAEYKYQEAAFYGNVFVSPPQAFYCVGADYASSAGNGFEARSCQGYQTRDGACPFVETGHCNEVSSLRFSRRSSTQDDLCTWTGPESDTALSCTDNLSSRRSSGRTWSYPITTFRKEQE